MTITEMKSKMEELAPIEGKLNQEMQRTKEAYHKAIGAWGPVSRELQSLRDAINLTEKNP